MRVALVYRNFNLRGSLERDSVLLARALAGLGVDVHCYCNPNTRSADLAGVTFHDIVPATVSRSRFGYPLECCSFAIAATKALRRDRHLYDVVDVRGIAAWEADVFTVHAVSRGEQRRWPDEAGRGFRAARLRSALAPLVRPENATRRTIERLQFRRGRYRRVIAVTERVRRDLEEVHGVSHQVVDVIPPPIDLQPFTRSNGGDLRRRLGLEPGERLLLFVGHAFERKGLTDAIEILAGLTPDTHLVVVGNGERGPFLRAAEGAGIADRVHFLGGTDQPHRFFHESDVFLLPTRHDPWGITLIEAMAAGVPVVSTEIAGAAHVVRQAGAGLIFPAGSTAAMRDAVAGLLADPEARRAMGERGRQAAEGFSAEAQGKATFAVYEKVVAERPARRIDGGRPRR
jgi:glycosyltransferase involved in cell wall biosynthesis